MNLHEMNTRIKMDKRDTWALQRAALYIQRLLWNKGAQLQVCWCRPATLAFRTDAVRGKPVPQSGMCLKRQQIRTQTLERQWPCHSGTAPQICNPFCVHCRTEQSTLRQWVCNHRRKTTGVAERVLAECELRAFSFLRLSCYITWSKLV